MSENSTVPDKVRPFEPNLQMLWGQVIGFSGTGALAVALLDCLKLARECSFLRAACVWGGCFAAAMGVYWFRSGRHGGQTLVADEKRITVQNTDSRALLL